MDKTEELELMELQDLALHHSSQRRKTLGEKCMIVKAYLVNHVPVPQLCEEFGVSRQSIYRWIHIFADGKMPGKETRGTSEVKQKTTSMPKKKPESEESAAEELARLRAESKRLSEALKMAEWMCHAKDVMIDEAEKAFNIPIRKKSGAKQ